MKKLNIFESIIAIILLLGLSLWNIDLMHDINATSYKIWHDSPYILLTIFFPILSGIVGFGWKKIITAFKIVFDVAKNINKCDLITGTDIFKTMFLSSIL